MAKGSGVTQSITYPNANSASYDAKIGSLNAEHKEYFNYALIAYLTANVSAGTFAAAVDYASKSAATKQLV